MTFPDVDTLRLCSMLASTAFGLVFGCLWLRDRAELHFGLWSLSSLLYGFVILVFSLTPYAAYVIHTSLYAAMGVTDVLCVAGALRLEGRRPLRRWMLVPVIAPVIGHALPMALAAAGIIAPGSTWQTVGDASGLGLAMGLCGFVLAFRGDAAAYTGRRMAGVAMLCYLPAYILSIASEFWWPDAREPVALLAMLSDQILLGMLNLGLLAIPVEQVRRQLRDAALRDPLTEVWNRAGLEHLMPRFAQAGTVAVAIDVDHFKQINDENGHAAGDAVLALIGREACELSLAFGGEVVRLGGDEFVILLPATCEDPTSFAVLLQSRLQACSLLQTGWSVSMGIARMAPEDLGLMATIGRADASLYQAKARGRSRIAA